MATWVARIPAVKSKLHLSDGVLGVTLLWTAFGAVVGIPSCGLLLHRFTPRAVSIGSGILFCVSIVPFALAPNAFSLGAFLFFYGGVAAAMDVAMNAHGVAVEKLQQFPTMSRFHGWFSVGGMAGAAAGGAIAAHGITPSLHFAIAAATCAIATLACWPFMLTSAAPAEGSTSRPRPSFRDIPPVLYCISAIGFCILLSEGAMADWMAVYLRQILHSGPGIAAAGYSVFSAAMAIFRFLGDWTTAKLGAARMVFTGALLGAAGLSWALTVQTPLAALPGFAVVGAGFSSIIPLVFGSGGRIKGISPASGIATVTGLGYLGFIVGPPAIGLLAEVSTLRYALCFVVLCCIVSAVLATSLRTLGGPGDHTQSSPNTQPHP